MAYHTPNAGDFQFTFGFISSQILDSCTFVITQTMLMSKLKQDSRGVIISFNSMCYALGILTVY